MNEQHYEKELNWRNWEKVIDQLKQINTLLRCAHNLGIIEHPKTGEKIAISAAEMTPQQVMDMVDSNITIVSEKLHVNGCLITGAYIWNATDTARTPESLYPTNPNAVEDDNTYQLSWAPNWVPAYSDCVQIARELHEARYRCQT